MADCDDITLVADVGGTHARFGLSRQGDGHLVAPESVEQTETAHFETLTAALRHYLKKFAVAPSRAVFAAAGPVIDDEVRFTNNAWSVSAQELRARFSIQDVRVVNDLAALSAALPHLPAGSLHQLGSRALPNLDDDERKSVAVVGPGTGLGVGVLIIGPHHATTVLDTEGGHTAFAPLTDEERSVHRILSARFGRVSNERVVSGPGLVNLYRTLSVMEGTEPQLTTPEAVTDAAAAGSNIRAVRAVELFCRILGAFAGDVVLACGAWDGLYLAGGVARATLPWLELGGFRDRFESKGRLSEAIARVPTAIVTHELAGLIGAAALGSSRSVGVRA